MNLFNLVKNNHTLWPGTLYKMSSSMKMTMKIMLTFTVILITKLREQLPSQY